MTLVFGGAYMGKQDYAKAHLGAGEIEQCGSDLPSFRTGCVAGLERFSLACAEQKRDAAAALETCAAQWDGQPPIRRRAGRSGDAEGPVPLPEPIRFCRLYQRLLPHGADTAGSLR